METNTNTQELSKRLIAYSSELKSCIAERVETLAGIEKQLSSLNKPKEGRFDHAGYSLSEQKRHVETAILHSQEEANRFYKHFPEYNDSKSRDKISEGKNGK